MSVASDDRVKRRKAFYEKIPRVKDQERFELEVERAKVRLLKRSTDEVVLADVQLVEGSVTFAMGGESLTDFLSNEVVLVLECEVWITVLQAVEDELTVLLAMRDRVSAAGDRKAFIDLSGRYAKTLFKRDRLRAGERIEDERNITHHHH